MSHYQSCRIHRHTVPNESDPSVRRYRPPSEGVVRLQDLLKAAPAEPAIAAIQDAALGESVQEIGGRRDGTEPTRFGDWEKNGRCIDF